MHERHADPLDEATALAASLTNGAIAAAQRANEPEHHPDFDGTNCLDCDQPIPLKRLAMKRIRCVRCQEILEHKNKQLARQNWGAAPPWAGGLDEDPA